MLQFCPPIESSLLVYQVLKQAKAVKQYVANRFSILRFELSPTDTFLKVKMSWSELDL